MSSASGSIGEDREAGRLPVVRRFEKRTAERLQCHASVMSHSIRCGAIRRSISREGRPPSATSGDSQRCAVTLQNINDDSNSPCVPMRDPGLAHFSRWERLNVSRSTKRRIESACEPSDCCDLATSCGFSATSWQHRLRGAVCDGLAKSFGLRAFRQRLCFMARIGAHRVVLFY